MFYAIVAVICLLLDQLAKYWTASHIEVGETVPLIPGLLHAGLSGVRMVYIFLIERTV